MSRHTAPANAGGMPKAILPFGSEIGLAAWRASMMSAIVANLAEQILESELFDHVREEADRILFAARHAQELATRASTLCTEAEALSAP